VAGRDRAEPLALKWEQEKGKRGTEFLKVFSPVFSVLSCSIRQALRIFKENKIPEMQTAVEENARSGKIPPATSCCARRNGADMVRA